MPRLTNRDPTYRRLVSGQAVVTLNGQDVYNFQTCPTGPLGWRRTTARCFFHRWAAATTVLVKFTRRADINLDGVITPDDSAISGEFYDEILTLF